MDFKPFPCERKASFEPEPDIEAHRNVFCVNYDSCLNVAVKNGWGDWTCQRCPLRNNAKKPTASSFAQDRSRDRNWP
ncbi:MAG: hypothetical protein ACK4N5_11000 [Myxococcales bacterium]